MIFEVKKLNLMTLGVDIELEVYNKEYEDLELEADLYVRNFFEGYYEEDFLMSL